jgi:hypothetical protein
LAAVSVGRGESGKAVGVKSSVRGVSVGGGVVGTGVGVGSGLVAVGAISGVTAVSMGERVAGSDVGVGADTLAGWQATSTSKLASASSRM